MDVTVPSLFTDVSMAVLINISISFSYAVYISFHAVIFAQDMPCYADKNMDTAPAWAVYMHQHSARFCR